MNKCLLWLIRALGMLWSFWFFYWAVINEMIVWNKPSPNILNMILFVCCVILCTIPNFTETVKAAPQKTRKKYKPKSKKLLKKTTKKNVKIKKIVKKSTPKISEKKSRLQRLQQNVIDAKTAKKKLKAEQKLIEYLKLKESDKQV